MTRRRFAGTPRAAAVAAVVATVGLAAAGCSGGEADPGRPEDAGSVTVAESGRPEDAGSVTVADSAGVAVATRARPLAGPASAVRVARPPVWRLGWRDRDPSFERPQSGFLLPDGGAVVADGVRRTVWVLDGRGRIHARIEPRVAGTPAFDRPHRVVLVPPDSVLVIDATRWEATVWSRDGVLARSFALPRSADVGHVPAAVASGRFLTLPYAPTSPSGGVLRWVDGPLASIDPEGGGAEVASPTGHTPAWGGIARFPPELPNHGVLGAYPGGWVWASNRHGAVRWYRPDGTLARLFRDGTEPEGSIFAGTSTDLVVARDGAVWRGEDHYHGIPTSWVVVDADGAAVRRVRPPPRFRVLDVAGGRMLGAWQDDLGIESVAVLELGRRTMGQQLRAVWGWTVR